MTMNKRTIKWEKWIDPFGADMKDIEWPGAWGTFESDEAMKQRLKEQYGDQYKDDEDETPNPVKTARQSGPIGILNTPMGMIPLTEHTNPTKIFNFWTMHTNFRMTEDICEVLDETNGIETLDIFTPYRWRISIGKAFDTSKVKKEVQTRLNAKPDMVE